MALPKCVVIKPFVKDDHLLQIETNTEPKGKSKDVENFLIFGPAQVDSRGVKFQVVQHGAGKENAAEVEEAKPIAETQARNKISRAGVEPAKPIAQKQTNEKRKKSTAQAEPAKSPDSPPIGEVEEGGSVHIKHFEAGYWTVADDGNRIAVKPDIQSAACIKYTLKRKDDAGRKIVTFEIVSKKGLLPIVEMAAGRLETDKVGSIPHEFVVEDWKEWGKKEEEKQKHGFKGK